MVVKEDEMMKIGNYDKIIPDKILLKNKRNYFLGDVVLCDVSKKIGVADQKIYCAEFKNGAKTKLHYHQGGQLLLVTKGVGDLVFYRKISKKGTDIKIKLIKKSRLKKGDMVYIPKKTIHWHGAVEKKDLTHVAFNAFTKGKESKTIWFESNFISHATQLD